MRKVLTLMLLIGLNIEANGQDISENALGLEFGSNDKFGGEILYQHSLSNKNRIEIDLGFSNSDMSDSFKLIGLYQWVYDFKNNFNWYVGVGGGFAKLK